MEIIRGVEQGSVEWHLLRSGLVTSSCFKKVMSGGKGLTREGYLYDLAYSRVTGKPTPDQFKSKDMERGNELEPQARAMYELETGNDVEEITFIKLDDDIGSSTDGLISDDKGLTEFKCPLHKTHMKYMIDPSKFEKEYWQQVQGEIWVSGRDYVDLVSFHPDFPLVIRKVLRDNKAVAEISIKVAAFVIDLKELVLKLEATKH